MTGAYRAPDREKMLTILRHFKDMPERQYSIHASDTYCPDIDEANCPRCIGIHAAEAMDIQRAHDWFLDGKPHFHMADGENAIADAMGQDTDRANAALHRHGAPPDPFCYDIWPMPPFEILKPAFEEADDQKVKRMLMIWRGSIYYDAAREFIQRNFEVARRAVKENKMYRRELPQPPHRSTITISVMTWIGSSTASLPGPNAAMAKMRWRKSRK